MTPYNIFIYPWWYPVPVVGARYLVNNRSVHIPAATGTRNAGLFVLNMQLYVNVLIAQSRLDRAVQHRYLPGQPGSCQFCKSIQSTAGDDQIIQRSSYFTPALVPRQCEWRDVLRFGGIKIFSSDDCKITLRLTGYLLGTICSSMSMSLFCNELSPLTIK